MAEIFEALVAYFTKDEWNFSEHASLPMLKLGYQGEGERWDCFARAREDERQFIFLSVSPVKAGEARRPAMAELLTRINFGLNIGNFEMDMDDGEVRYKTSIALGQEALSEELIRQVVYANVSVMDTYLQSILTLASSTQSALEVYNSIPADA